MAPSFDSELLRRWIDAATRSLARHRSEIDRINVFPIPDGDTGSNMLLTVQSALRALDPAGRPGTPDDGDPDAGGAAADPEDVRSTAAALAGGALRGARGNSGLILTQLWRGLADELAARAASDRRTASAAGGALFASALQRSAALAAAAVHRPKRGTILTVLEAAAEAASGLPEGTPLPDTAAVAARAAGEALERTTAQLPELARAKVVDAGGMGLVLILDSLAEVLGGARRLLPLASGQQKPATRPETWTTRRESGSDAHDYEVMYLLHGSDTARVETLRGELDAIGDSVTTVGDGAADGAGTWNVHVHCTDVGAAIEAGIRAGRPSGITVLRFADQIDDGPAALPGDRSGFVLSEAPPIADPVPASGPAWTATLLTEPISDGGSAHDEQAQERGSAPAAESADVPIARSGRARAVLLLIDSHGAAALARGSGGDVFRPGDDPSADEVGEAIAATGAAHVVVLPCDDGRRTVAERAAAAVQEVGREVVVVPSTSVLQGLAALAVHDPDRRAGDDVVAMAEAAASTRTGALMLSESNALTWAGPCQPGDVLGVSDGEVVLIAPDLAVGALWLAHRMLTPGGELVTALLGAAAPDALGVSLAEDLRRTHPEVDVVVHRGEQWDHPLVLGVE